MTVIEWLQNYRKVCKQYSQEQMPSNMLNNALLSENYRCLKQRVCEKKLQLQQIAKENKQLQQKYDKIS